MQIGRPPPSSWARQHEYLFFIEAGWGWVGFRKESRRRTDSELLRRWKLRGGGGGGH